MGLPHRHTDKSINTLSESLRRFVPLKSLDPERRDELARHAKLVNQQAGRKLFSCGDSDKYLVYLLDGEVELRSARDTFIVDSETKQATMPLDVYIPHRYTAITVTPVILVYIERNLLDVLMASNTAGEYSVEDINETSPEGDDWMSMILRSTLFHKIPPVNIQRMLASLEQISSKAGTILFKEGDKGEDFYFIQSGRIQVICRVGDKHQVVANLGAGDSFGEEALLSSQHRNATIRCESDTTLLRLSRADFDEFLKTPVVQQVSFMHAQSLYQSGAVWLDVRQPEEQQEIKIKHALSIPLGKLRACIPRLDLAATYITICDNGQRSACAAYLLNAYGINAVVLKNGLNN